MGVGGLGAPPPPPPTRYSLAPSPTPLQVDVTIQSNDHWFFTPQDSLHSLSDMARFYRAWRSGSPRGAPCGRSPSLTPPLPPPSPPDASVGANGHLEIDFAIDRTGNVAPAHAALYSAFGGWIRSCYGKAPLAAGALAAGAYSLTLPLPAGAAPDRVVLQETLTGGQFLVAYAIEAQVGGAWQPFSKGVTVGSKRIDVLGAAVAGATALRLNVTEAYAPGHAGVTLAVLDGAGCATA